MERSFGLFFYEGSDEFGPLSSPQDLNDLLYVSFQETNFPRFLPSYEPVLLVSLLDFLSLYLEIKLIDIFPSSDASYLFLTHSGQQNDEPAKYLHRLS